LHGLGGENNPREGQKLGKALKRVARLNVSAFTHYKKERGKEREAQDH